jgi:ribosomal protein S6
LTMYEAMWVCDATKGKEDITKLTSQLTEMIERAGGKVVNCQKWDERRLAYPIRDINKKKHRRAIYCLSHFDGQGDSVSKLERQAKLTDIVLRLLVTRDEDGTDITPPATDDIEPIGRQGGRRGYGDHDRDHSRDRGDRDRDRDRPRDRDRRGGSDSY